MAGDPELGGGCSTTLAAVRVGAGLTEDDRRAIRRMKARVETERIPPGEDPEFHLKLGRGALADVELTAQLLQLEHGIRDHRHDRPLDALRAAAALSGDEADALVAAHRFCDRTRNRWFLVGRPRDALPRGRGPRPAGPTRSAPRPPTSATSTAASPAAPAASSSRGSTAC